MHCQYECFDQVLNNKPLHPAVMPSLDKLTHSVNVFHRQHHNTRQAVSEAGRNEINPLHSSSLHLQQLNK